MTEELLISAALAAKDDGSFRCLAVRLTNRDVMDDELASFSMEFSHFEQKR